MSTIRKILGFVIIMFIIFGAGCTGIGSHTIARDRFDYVSSISESWKRQTLLNLLKTRYVDAPVYMDITSVINQYAVEGQLQFGLSWADGVNGQTMGGTGKYTDRPTITYSPMVGEKFTRSMITPIPISGILFLVQAGYPADYVLRICVQTINGIKNSSGMKMMQHDGDTEFYELLTLIHSCQSKGGMGMRVQSEDDQGAVVMFFRPSSDPAIAKEIARIKQILNIDPNEQTFNVIYGSYAQGNTEIAILSRSMLQVMIEYASYIDVPESDIAEGRVSATYKMSPEVAARFPSLIRVSNDKSSPDDAYVSVRYRNRWYWIDDRDDLSKRTFYFLMLLFSLTDRGVSQGAPIVTVPTN